LWIRKSQDRGDQSLGKRAESPRAAVLPAEAGKGGQGTGLKEEKLGPQKGNLRGAREFGQNEEGRRFSLLMAQRRKGTGPCKGNCRRKKRADSDEY